MNVNIGFLGDDPIENVITFMHHKIEKAVFFGYFDAIGNYRTAIERFLVKNCGVEKVVFIPLSQKNLQNNLDRMREEIELEKSQGANLFFDITAGENLSIFAFGMLAKQYNSPVHFYDVWKNNLIELDEGSELNISTDVPKQKVKINLDKLIALRGGKINYNLHKNVKNITDAAFKSDVDKIWDVAVKFHDRWNSFSNFLNEFLITEDEIEVYREAVEVDPELLKNRGKMNSPEALVQILNALKKKGLIKDLVCDGICYRFSFKSPEVKGCLTEGGSVLELRTYMNEADNSSDCRVGVHIDWDGIIHPEPGSDVLNEIDVLSLNGCIPTFISCKSGKMSPNAALYALYELDTVARRFGGKYAKKVLVTVNPLLGTYRERAEELGIELR